MKRFAIALVATIAVLLPAGSLVQAASCNGASHQPPVLSNGSANPGSGSSTTPITFSVVYADSAGCIPSSVAVSVTGVGDVRHDDVRHELHDRRDVPGDPGHPRRLAHLLVRSGERIGCRPSSPRASRPSSPARWSSRTRHRPRLRFRRLLHPPHRSRLPCRRRRPAASSTATNGAGHRVAERGGQLEPELQPDDVAHGRRSVADGA